MKILLVLSVIISLLLLSPIVFSIIYNKESNEPATSKKEYKRVKVTYR